MNRVQMSIKNTPLNLDHTELYNSKRLELYTLIQDTKKAKQKIDTENILLERYLRTCFPSLKISDKDNVSVTDHDISDEEELDESDIYSHISSCLSSFKEKECILPKESKCEIDTSVVETVKERECTLDDDWYNNIIPYKAKIGELMIDLQDLQIDIYNFSRALIKEIGIITSQLTLERILKYFQNSIRNKEATLERCRLNCVAISNLKSKIQTQLKKEYLNDSFDEIVDNMKGDNALSNAKEKNGNLAVIKNRHFMSLTLQCLGQYKIKLMQLLVHDKEMKDLFKMQRDYIAGLEIFFQMAQHVPKESKMNHHVSHLRYKIDKYRVPDVMDYITTQAEIYELNKIVKVWRRRIHNALGSRNARSTFWNRLNEKNDTCETKVTVDQ